LFASGELKRTKTAREQYFLVRIIFMNLYDASGGITVPKNKTRLVFQYSPASSGLYDQATINIPANWCDPMVLKRPVSTLAKIAEDLMPKVRKAAKALSSNNFLEVLVNWPLALEQQIPEGFEKQISKVDDFFRENKTISVGSICSLFNLDLKDKVTKTQLTKLSAGLEKCGWVMVPDPIISPVGSMALTDSLLVYQGNRINTFSESGLKIDTNIRMSALIARSDGEIHKAEVSLISNYINNHAESDEQMYLLHYADWRLNNKTSVAGLKNQLDNLKVKDQGELAKLLIDVANADGALLKEEIKELEKLFTKIGFEKSLVAKYLHESNQNAVTIQPIGKVDDINDASVPKIHTIEINSEKLKKHEESTKEIQSVLTQIFEEDTSEPELELIEPHELSSELWHKGTLDNKLLELTEWLVTKEEWARNDVENKCNKLGLMIDGALESINEVAFDCLGDSLVDIDDPIVVYHDVLPAQL